VLDLYIPQKEQTLRSQVIWRNGHEFGVAFPQAMQAETATGGSGDLADRVAKLEAEMALIKRTLKKLKADAGPTRTIPKRRKFSPDFMPTVAADCRKPLFALCS